ncbi:hypothetical protein GGI12_005368, partial [Dipsacomyces acuminosporus]
MQHLNDYLIGVIESSYQDLAHLVPCGSFLGLFDERPIKRTKLSSTAPMAIGTFSTAPPAGININGPGISKQQQQQQRHVPAPAYSGFEFDDSETTCTLITQLALSAISSSVPPAEVLKAVVDAIRNIHDASPVLDIGFRSLFEIYQSRLGYHCANRYSTGGSAPAAAAGSSKQPSAFYSAPEGSHGKDGGGVAFSGPQSLRDTDGGSEGVLAPETFGEEYLILTSLFELHRPRTWVAAVRLVSMVTKSAIRIMYGGTTPGDPPSLSSGTHAASLSEISGLNLLPENVCREMVRQVWRLLLDSSATEPRTASVLGSARRTRWQIRFEATMELFDCFVGRSEQCLGRPLLSYYLISRELDPGAAVAESGMLASEMQTIVDLCFGRKRRLGRILLPPDGSWPLISHASRAHTVKHVYDQPAYALVRDSLTFEETERGPSANKYVADLLYQRAPTDEIFAAIRNHRIMKKKAMAAVANDSYVPNHAVHTPTIGGSPGLAQNGSGIGAGGLATLSDNAEAEKHEVAQLLLEALSQRTEHIVRYIQSQCDFETLINERKLNEHSDASMLVPRS